MNDVVYHYTDANGLLGIFRTGQLWATHISYLNDSQEHKHSGLVYRDVLIELWKDSNLDLTARKFAETALTHLDRQEQSSSPLLSGSNYFVASFSEKEDDLAQWRGYRGSGPKFCLGFRTSELTKLEHSRSMRFDPVSYDSKIAAGVMKTTFLSAISELTGKWLTPATGYTEPFQIHPPEFHDLNQQVVGATGPLLKHEKFIDEAEWRLHSFASTNFAKNTLGFRSGKSWLIPYVEVDLTVTERPIVSIRVGPTPHMQESIAAVRRLVSLLDPKALFQAGGRIHGSVIPYRDW